ncbi:sn-glycerol-3-phosphate transport system permease protein UgpA [compost metagenome]
MIGGLNDSLIRPLIRKVTNMRLRNSFVKENLTGYLFILPQMLIFLAFLVYPILEGIRLSMYKISYTGETFVGFDNYATLFSDPVFFKALFNTVVFVIFIVILTVGFALFVASAIFDKNAKYVSFIRGSYYIPVMVSMVVMSMVWSFLLNPANGLISYLARESGMGDVNLLGNPQTVLPVVIFVTFAGNVGQAIILYIASMIGVSKDLFEAAEVDGASRWHVITKILIPSVSSTTIYITIINIIAVLKIFVVIQLLTGGGPNNSSVTLMYYLYNNAFKYNQLGVASAVGVIMFAITLVLSIPQLKAMIKQK